MWMMRKLSDRKTRDLHRPIAERFEPEWVCPPDPRWGDHRHHWGVQVNSPFWPNYEDGRNAIRLAELLMLTISCDIYAKPDSRKRHHAVFHHPRTYKETHGFGPTIPEAIVACVAAIPEGIEDRDD